jgi:hypothetical protein
MITEKIFTVFLLECGQPNEKKMEGARVLGLHPARIKMKSFVCYLRILFELLSTAKEGYVRKMEMCTTQFLIKF